MEELVLESGLITPCAYAQKRGGASLFVLSATFGAVYAFKASTQLIHLLPGRYWGEIACISAKTITLKLNHVFSLTSARDSTDTTSVSAVNCEARTNRTPSRKVSENIECKEQEQIRLQEKLHSDNRSDS